MNTDCFRSSQLLFHHLDACIHVDQRPTPIFSHQTQTTPNEETTNISFNIPSQLSGPISERTRVVYDANSCFA